MYFSYMGVVAKEKNLIKLCMRSCFMCDCTFINIKNRGIFIVYISGVKIVIGHFYVLLWLII